MEHAQIDRIRTDWASVRPLAAIAIHRFYGHLLNQDADARVLVPDNFTLQGWKLVMFIDDVVVSLEMPSVWISLVRNFARCDAARNLVDRHLNSVGNALLKALGDVLAERFTPESREAWACAYELVANATYAATVDDVRTTA